MKQRLIVVLALLVGVALGGVLPRRLAGPALAETPTPMATMAPSMMPMATAAPSMVPMGGMMDCRHMMNMMHIMMPAPKSAADRAYMGAMMEMHGAMMRGSMTGNADEDFLMMMIPHHQAAVEMAQTELQYGKDVKVKSLARNIITPQEREISEMRSWMK